MNFVFYSAGSFVLEFGKFTIGGVFCSRFVLSPTAGHYVADGTKYWEYNNNLLVWYGTAWGSDGPRLIYINSNDLSIIKFMSIGYPPPWLADL